MEKARIEVILDEETHDIDIHSRGVAAPVEMLNMFAVFARGIYSILAKYGFKQEDTVAAMTSIIQKIPDLKGENL